jgi:endonuclease III
MVITKIVQRLNKATRTFVPPLSDIIVAEYGHDPFLMLISCLLSLRAKDVTTIHVARALFARAKTPRQLLAIKRKELEKIIYKSGFYKNKAKVLHEVSRDLIERFGGKVPRTRDELLSMKGIGIKTANLVLGQSFGIPAICVDTHVHRISNRLGIIKTKTVEQTEIALATVLPKKYWNVWNHLLVMWGQNICVPISPKCSQCAIRDLCKRVGVTKSR